jgi:hypothetical protein
MDGIGRGGREKPEIPSWCSVASRSESIWQLPVITNLEDRFLCIHKDTASRGSSFTFTFCVVSRYNFPITTGNALEQRRNVCMAGPAPGLSDILPALDLYTVYLENRFWHFE